LQRGQLQEEQKTEAHNFGKGFGYIGYKVEGDPITFHNLEHSQWCSIFETPKIFLTSEFSYLLFCNPTHKTERLQTGENY
jgi:hypothetical protein